MMIRISKEFSRFPAGRFYSDGPWSGQKFREEFLIPALRSATDTIEIQMDGTLGYGSSFLEEAFGGLVRLHGFNADDLLRRLVIVTTDLDLKFDIDSYIRRATPRKA